MIWSLWFLGGALVFNQAAWVFVMVMRGKLVKMYRESLMQERESVKSLLAENFGLRAELLRLRPVRGPKGRFVSKKHVVITNAVVKNDGDGIRIGEMKNGL